MQTSAPGTKKQLEKLQEHREITEAIKNSDEQLAERLTKEQFRKAETIRLTMLRMMVIQNSMPQFERKMNKVTSITYA